MLCCGLVTLAIGQVTFRQIQGIAAQPAMTASPRSGRGLQGAHGVADTRAAMIMNGRRSTSYVYPATAGASGFQAPLNQLPSNFEEGRVLPVSVVRRLMASRHAANKFAAERGERIVFLTIDDGPSHMTPEVLDILSRYDVHATFFVLGSCAASRRSLIRREFEEGHAIANHTYYHRYHHDIQSFADEVARTDEAIRSALGDICPEFHSGVVRFPGGSYGRSQALKHAYDSGDYVYMDWNVSSADTSHVHVDAMKIFYNVKSYDRLNVQVVLLHDAGAKRSLPLALENIIPYYLDNGFTFYTICSDRAWREMGGEPL